MSILTRYCQKCTCELSRLGFDYLQIFINICHQYIQDGEPLEISEDFLSSQDRFFSVIKGLEKNGYLISTESELDLIQLKPLGIRCAYEGSKDFIYKDDEKEDDLICYVCLKDSHL